MLTSMRAMAIPRFYYSTGPSPTTAWKSFQRFHAWSLKTTGSQYYLRTSPTTYPAARACLIVGSPTHTSILMRWTKSALGLVTSRTRGLKISSSVRIAEVVDKCQRILLIHHQITFEALS